MIPQDLPDMDFEDDPETPVIFRQDTMLRIPYPTSPERQPMNKGYVGMVPEMLEAHPCLMIGGDLLQVAMTNVVPAGTRVHSYGENAEGEIATIEVTLTRDMLLMGALLELMAVHSAQGRPSRSYFVEEFVNENGTDILIELGT